MAPDTPKSVRDAASGFFLFAITRKYEFSPKRVKTPVKKFGIKSLGCGESLWAIVLLNDAYQNRDITHQPLLSYS